MTIDATLHSAVPMPAGKTAAPSAHQRAAGDAPGDGSGAASFLAMLQAVSLASAGPATSPAVDGGVAPAPAGQDGAVEQGGDASGASDASDALDGRGVAVTVSQIAVALAPAAASVADAAALDTAVAEPGVAGAPARKPGTATMAADDRRPGGAAAATAMSAPEEPQDMRMASDAAVAQVGARKAASAARATDAMARQQIADAAEAVASARGGGRADAAVQARDAVQATSLQPQVPSHSGAGATAVVSMFEAGLAGLRAGPGARTQERGAARAPLAEGAQTGFVAWSDATPGNQSAQAANPVYAPTAATPVPSAALAQKLHYWVAGGVQSAELQLDAFGGGAVDVHIAVRGEEAFVEFRSDQPQARKLLLDAMPQLKELLAGEGLLLSGGFVGGSAQHPSDGRGTRSDRFAAARGTAPAQGAAPAVIAPMPMRGAAGSAVDLFV